MATTTREQTRGSLSISLRQVLADKANDLPAARPEGNRRRPCGRLDEPVLFRGTPQDGGNFVAVGFGEHFMLKLNDEDGRAVDLYLEARADGDGAGNGSMAIAPARLRGRLEAVGEVMELIGEMPASEPPGNLLAKTLAAVEARGGATRNVVPAERAATTARIHA